MMEHRSIQNYPNTTVAPSSSKRNGKIGAMNRIMEFVKLNCDFSDANTNLGKQSILTIVNLFSNPKVGCVSGEKQLLIKESDDVAAGAGY
jgi:cellulose synthase/poly-beta-1,6-N-acetylglucosamine synthase-like glycosyltransferase